MKRAQIGVEWLLAIGAVFLIFLFVLGIAFDRRIEIIKTERFTNLRNECSKMAEMIMFTFLNGKGTVLQFQIYYNTSFDASNRLVQIIDRELVSCTVPVNQVSTVNLVRGKGILINNGSFVQMANV